MPKDLRSSGEVPTRISLRIPEVWASTAEVAMPEYDREDGIGYLGYDELSHFDYQAEG